MEPLQMRVVCLMLERATNIYDDSQDSIIRTFQLGTLDLIPFKTLCVSGKADFV